MRARSLHLLVLLASLGAAPRAIAAEVAEMFLLDAPLESRRFADSATPGPSFKAGQRVTVLAVEGGRVRLYVGDSYGWVSASELDAAASEVPVIPLTPAD
ncbi:MAG: hypothetical protein H6732_08550 [Alphaproteobacteria bacterium]|nr:hypothetical protein [Alphaproteobacteria bacterium]